MTDARPSAARIYALVALAAALSTGACASRAGDVPDTQPAPVQLQSGDMLDVKIWREEELSDTVAVDEYGMVTLPLLGPKTVTEAPWPEIKTALLDEYRLHLRNPSISLTPLRRVNVLGEVRMPGRYEVDPTVSLAGVIALAGGATANGSLENIRIIRNGRVIRERIWAGASLSSADIRSGDQIFVEQRSWFVRNSTFVVSMLLSVTSIAITLIQQARSG